MKKIIVALLVVIMTIGISAPTASAAVIGTFDYTVFPARVNMTAQGTGSFCITVPASATPYAGVQYEVQLADGVVINSVSYSLQDEAVLKTPPETPPENLKPNVYYFSFAAVKNGSTFENRYTAAVTCTVNVTYTGTTEKAIRINEIKQFAIKDGTETNDRVSDKTTAVTLVPNRGEVSTDASLSSLTISEGTLVPGFSPNTTAYTAAANKDARSITVTAVPSYAGASVVGAGDRELAVGDNTINVTVTAEDGETKRTYTIVVTRPADSTNVDDPGGGGTHGSGGGSGAPPVGEIDDAQTALSAIFPFADVGEGDWHYNDVYYVWEKSLMDGTGEGIFSPNMTLTRGMVVAVLYRHEGRPSVEDMDNPFPDVAEGIWYTDAVMWASEGKVIQGYDNGNFGPNDNVTREQLATILYRYAEYAEADIPASREYPGFNDDASISEYARVAVTALYRAEVINGRPNNRFDPKGSATRAEFAAMIHRFLEV